MRGAEGVLSRAWYVTAAGVRHGPSRQVPLPFPAAQKCGDRKTRNDANNMRLPGHFFITKQK